MKKYFLLLILFLIPISVFAKNNANNLIGLKKELMTKIELEKVVSLDKSVGAIAVQNMKYTNKYIFITQSTYGEGIRENPIIVLDRETNKVVKELSYNIGHGNDITYNNRTREIMFLKSLTDEVLICCFDYDTLEHTRDIKVEGISKAYALSYNLDNNSYYIGAGDKGYILDGLFQLVSSFDIKSNQTIQSFSYYNGFLYYSNYEAGFPNGYQTVYDGVFNPYDSIVYVFDINGKYIKGFYIPPINGEPTELEGISFYNGEAYFVFNNWYSGKIDIYKYKGDLLPLKNNKNIKNDELILDNFKDMASNNTLMYVISLVLVCLVSATIIFVGNRKLKV